MSEKFDEILKAYRREHVKMVSLENIFFASMIIIVSGAAIATYLGCLRVELFFIVSVATLLWLTIIFSYLDRIERQSKRDLTDNVRKLIKELEKKNV